MNNNILLKPLKNFYSIKKHLELLVVILNDKNSNIIENKPVDGIPLDEYWRIRKLWKK